MRVSPEYASSVLHVAAPAWVADRSFDLNAAPPEDERVGGGVWNLLSDVQHNLEERIVFQKRITKLATEAGVGNGSPIQIYFSPHLHQLQIHSLVIHRGDKSLDILPGRDVQIFNREAAMEWDMFDGYLTAMLLLKDTRIGDVISFSFSVRTIHGLPHEQNSGRFVPQGSGTSKVAQWSLLYAPKREIYTVSHNCDAKPAVAYADSGLVECRWEVKNQSPVMVEPGTPSWYMPFGVVEYSEYRSWKEVAEWCCYLFYASSEVPPEFGQIVENIAAGASTFEDRVARALRFVQDEIRYVSISIGEHSHKPYDIATILERRYGDCKDKASLFSAILRALGYDALPALVHSVYRHSVAHALPSPRAFNHVITRVRHNGRTYWFDGTLSGQRGSLDRISCPAYGKALVVSPDTAGLEEVVSPASRNSSLKIIESFKIHHHTAADFSVTRIYEGDHANSMRRHLANSSQNTVEQNYLNKYLVLYPGTKVARPRTMRDNDAANRLEMSFEYQVAGLWRPEGPRSPRCIADFYATGIHHVVQHPPTVARRVPYAIRYPNNIENELSVRTTRPLIFQRGQAKVECAAFEYQAHISVMSNAVQFDMRFNARKDHVMPKEMKEFSESIGKVAGHVRQSLRLNVPPPQQVRRR